MGPIMTVATTVGSLAAGTGACLATEGLVMGVGNAVTTSKIGRVCVGIAAWTLGAVAFDYTAKKFTDQVIEIDEFREKLAKAITKAKVEPKKEEGPKDAAKPEEVNGGE